MAAEIPHVINNMESPRRLIRKVSPELRTKNKMLGGSSPYDPVMVSLGPHHHGKSELQQAEEFKKICLDQFLDGVNVTRDHLHRSIRLKIVQVRNSYAGVSPINAYHDKYNNNDSLADMMLLDACFIIRYMEIRTTETDDDVWSVWRYHLGDAGCHRFAERDIMVLENQIPLFVLKLVMSHKYPEEEIKDLVAKFMGWALYMKNGSPLNIPRQDEDPPVHILAAFRRVLIERAPIPPPEHDQPLWLCCRPVKENNYYTCGSVTDLKGKGIYCVGESYKLLDIEFKAHALYGKLRLPVRYISDGTLVYFSNMIAYEICPRSEPTNLSVCSYISLMKSLIQTPADVKELQEAGVLPLIGSQIRSM